MRVGQLIFSRMSSSRLPGKALCHINGRALLGRVIDRARRVERETEIVIATSELNDDDSICSFAEKEGVLVYRGDLDNVAGRALACCREFGFDYFVRICGDRPFLSPILIDQLLDIAVKNNLDLATNCMKKTFPAGMATEIVKTDALLKVLERSQDHEDMEHVTRYFYKNPQEFNIFNLESSDQSFATVNLAIDTKDDLEKANWIERHLTDADSDSLEVIVALSKSWELSAHNEQKEMDSAEK